MDLDGWRSSKMLGLKGRTGDTGRSSGGRGSSSVL
jgi:hypothetical protein